MAAFLDVLLFLGSLALTLAAAAFFARRLDRVGLHLGLPETMLGLLTALAADAPEVSSAVAALVKGEHGVGVGVVIGSNIFNLAAMIGLGAMLFGGIRIQREALAVEGAVGLAATVIVGALLITSLGPGIALALLAAVLVPYLTLLSLGPTRAPRPLLRFFGERHRPDHRLAHGETILVPALTLVPAVAIVVLGSIGMVDAATSLGNRWNVPDVIIGTIVLAVLTSLPNAFTAARLALQRRGAAVVSETFNSNTVNLVFGIAVPALFVSFGSLSGVSRFGIGWMLLMTVVVIALLARRGGFGRLAGLAILALYTVFVAVQIGFAAG
jgi:cation:H+ antiporter